MKKPSIPVLLYLACASAFFTTACNWNNTGVQANLVSPSASSNNPVLEKDLLSEKSTEGVASTTVPAGASGSVSGAVAGTAATNNAAAILALPQVPILCYHQIRDYKPTDSRSARDYIIPPADFKAQMKGLADSGYTTVLPEDIYAYLTTGKSLPAKPVMLSFDDGCDEQFSLTREILNPLRFKAAYFIMTVSVNRPNYMKAEEIRQLAEEGHSIGLHTWDHHNVKQYQGNDWVTQIEKPKAQLEKITGRPVQFFAYPFGLWNPQAIPELKNRGLVAAFQLSTARDQNDPLYTIRRIIVPGGWSGAQLVNRMKNSFH